MISSQKKQIVLEKLRGYQSGLLTAESSVSMETPEQDASGLDVVDTLLSSLQSKLAQSQSMSYVVGMFGASGVGKSTTINSIMGCNILPVRTKSTISSVTGVPSIMMREPGEGLNVIVVKSPPPQLRSVANDIAKTAYTNPTSFSLTFKSLGIPHDELTQFLKRAQRLTNTDVIDDIVERVLETPTFVSAMQNSECEHFSFSCDDNKSLTRLHELITRQSLTIQLVVISGNFGDHCRLPEGVVLVDLPGFNDINTMKMARLEAMLRSIDSFWYIVNQQHRPFQEGSIDLLRKIVYARSMRKVDLKIVENVDKHSWTGDNNPVFPMSTIYDMMEIVFPEAAVRDMIVVDSCSVAYCAESVDGNGLHPVYEVLDAIAKQYVESIDRSVSESQLMEELISKLLMDCNTEAIEAEIRSSKQVVEEIERCLNGVQDFHLDEQQFNSLVHIYFDEAIEVHAGYFQSVQWFLLRGGDHYGRRSGKRTELSAQVGRYLIERLTEPLYDQLLSPNSEYSYVLRSQNDIPDVSSMVQRFASNVVHPSFVAFLDSFDQYNSLAYGNMSKRTRFMVQKFRETYDGTDLIQKARSFVLQSISQIEKAIVSRIQSLEMARATLATQGDLLLSLRSKLNHEFDLFSVTPPCHVLPQYSSDIFFAGCKCRNFFLETETGAIAQGSHPCSWLAAQLVGVERSDNQTVTCPFCGQNSVVQTLGLEYILVKPGQLGKLGVELLKSEKEQSLAESLLRSHEVSGQLDDKAVEDDLQQQNNEDIVKNLPKIVFEICDDYDDEETLEAVEQTTHDVNMKGKKTEQLTKQEDASEGAGTACDDNFSVELYKKFPFRGWRRCRKLDFPSPDGMSAFSIWLIKRERFPARWHTSLDVSYLGSTHLARFSESDIEGLSVIEFLERIEEFHPEANTARDFVCPFPAIDDVDESDGGLFLYVLKAIEQGGRPLATKVGVRIEVRKKRFSGFKLMKKIAVAVAASLLTSLTMGVAGPIVIPLAVGITAAI